MDQQYTLEYIQSFIRRQTERGKERSTSLSANDFQGSCPSLTTKDTLSEETKSSDTSTTTLPKLQSKRSASFTVSNPTLHSSHSSGSREPVWTAETDGVTSNTSAMDAPPSAERQKQVIASIEGQEESMHVYCVAKFWHERWKKYVHLDTSDENTNNAPKSETTNKDSTTTSIEEDRKKPPSPGPLWMDLEKEENNTFIDESIWRVWLSWYGLREDHQLDRRNWASDDKEFEVCVLSPYSGIVQHPTKTLDISEQTGYVEVQLRALFGVPQHRLTRLWLCEKARAARFTLILERSRELCFQDGLDGRKQYILALEIAGLGGEWPTQVPGAPHGSLQRYDAVTRGPTPSGEYWENELASAITTVFSGVSAELQETMSGIVNTTKCITGSKERELVNCRQQLESSLQQLNETQSGLELKLREVSQAEETAERERKRAQQEREQLDNERQQFDVELKQMEQLNTITASRIKLDVGGHVYVTSIQTLTRDPNSMLAAMFSGRHALSASAPNNSYFIDRDGTHFRYVLNFLRDGGFRQGALPRDQALLVELLTEAEYYQITGLSQLLSTQLQRLQGGTDSGESDAGHHKPKPPPQKRNPSIHQSAKSAASQNPKTPTGASVAASPSSVATTPRRSKQSSSRNRTNSES